MATVTMLNRAKWIESNSQPNGNSAQAQINVGPYTSKAILFIAAHGLSQCTGAATTSGAGIQLLVELDGSTVSMDECYEGQPGGTMTFQSSASYACPLDAGGAAHTVTARIAPYGAAAATNRNTTVTLTCIVLAADW